MLIFKHQMTCDSNKQTKKRDLVLHLFVWTYELLRRGLQRTLTYNDVLQNGFRVNPVWLIREKVMSAGRNNHHLGIVPRSRNLSSNRFPISYSKVLSAGSQLEESDLREHVGLQSPAEGDH